MEEPEIIIRPVQTKEDVKEVVDLTLRMFPEEARATGVPTGKWRELKIEELTKTPELWPQCGVACEGAKTLGAVVMTVDDEPDAALSYWELPRRVGCLPTLLTMFYDQVLEEPLDPHECLIDFLAVSPDARGKGVGKALMQWAERTAVEILSRRVPQEVQSKGVRMTLWVAADNATACNLYSRSGYTVVKRTGEGLFACFSSRVFQRFLGHPIWLKMQKTLPPPETVGKDQPSKVITIVVDSAHRRSSLAAIAALEYAKQQQEEAAKVVATKKSASRAA